MLLLVKVGAFFILSLMFFLYGVWITIKKILLLLTIILIFKISIMQMLNFLMIAIMLIVMVYFFKDLISFVHESVIDLKQGLNRLDDIIGTRVKDVECYMLENFSRKYDIALTKPNENVIVGIVNSDKFFVVNHEKVKVYTEVGVITFYTLTNQFVVLHYNSISINDECEEKVRRIK